MYCFVIIVAARDLVQRTFSLWHAACATTHSCIVTLENDDVEMICWLFDSQNINQQCCQSILSSFICEYLLMSLYDSELNITGLLMAGWIDRAA